MNQSIAKDKRIKYRMNKELTNQRKDDRTDKSLNKGTKETVE